MDVTSIACEDVTSGDRAGASPRLSVGRVGSKLIGCSTVCWATSVSEVESFCGSLKLLRMSVSTVAFSYRMSVNA